MKQSDFQESVSLNRFPESWIVVRRRMLAALLHPAIASPPILACETREPRAHVECCTPCQQATAFESTSYDKPGYVASKCDRAVEGAEPHRRAGEVGTIYYIDLARYLVPARTGGVALTRTEIDHNFSRAHRIVTSSILPIVEQYGNHSRDVWEGSSVSEREISLCGQPAE